MKAVPVYTNLTPIDRPTVGKVVDKGGATVPPQPRTMVALTRDEIKGDCSVEDFAKWILNFAKNDTGHFADARCAQRFADDVSEYIRTTLKGFVDTGAFRGFLLSQITGSLAVHFTEQGAASDFARQVSDYIEVDGYIGFEDVSEEGTHKNRQTGKAERQSGKSRSSTSRRVRKST